MNLAKAFKIVERKRFIPLGGMPFSNGLMLRSLNHAVVAFRDETGRIEVFSFSTRNIREKIGLLFIPFLRGIFFVLENIYLALKVAGFKRGFTKKVLHRKPRGERIYFKVSQYVLYLIYLLLFVGFFDYLYIRLGSSIAIGAPAFFYSFIFSLLYILFFGVLSFLLYFGQKGELELFSYHGLEHKIINAHEKYGDISRRSIEKAGGLNNRCGLVILFWGVVFLAFFVTLFKINEAGWGVGALASVGIVFLSLSLSYEFVKVVSFSKILSAIFIGPLYLIQSLASHDPDIRHIHVGEVAYNEIIRLEKAK